MFDIHGFCMSALPNISPNRQAAIHRQIGFDIVDFQQIPKTERIEVKDVRIQSLSDSDLRLAEGLNISGASVSIYFRGIAHSAIRVGESGGDIMVFDDGSKYKIISVSERWDLTDWVKVMAVKQI